MAGTQGGGAELNLGTALGAVMAALSGDGNGGAAASACGAAAKEAAAVAQGAAAALEQEGGGAPSGKGASRRGPRGASTPIHGMG